MSTPEGTRKKILKAAMQEFIAKGKSGARMQSIADRAGVNKAMLHYYFTDKDHLHREVIEDTFQSVLRDILNGALTGKENGIEFISRFIEGYFNFLKNNPEFPRLVIWELAAGNEDFLTRIKKILEEMTPPIPDTVIRILKKSIEAGEIYPYEPQQLLISVLALVMFYFIGRPILKTIFTQEAGEKEFLDRREDHIKTFVLRAITPK